MEMRIKTPRMLDGTFFIPAGSNTQHTTQLRRPQRTPGIHPVPFQYWPNIKTALGEYLVSIFICSIEPPFQNFGSALGIPFLIFFL